MIVHAPPPRAARALPWLMPIIAILALAAPLLFTSRSFETDWTVHLYYLWFQSGAMKAFHFPSLFVHADLLGIFFPHYAFYGGTMYAIGGAIGALLGDSPVVAYVSMYVLAFSMAYGGVTWLAHQAGLRGWMAQLPALVLVTSAYYLTNAYGRGAYGEFVATSALPLVVAAGLHLIRAARWRVGPVLAFVVAAVLFSGSHNITLAWGSVFILGLLVVGKLALPSRGREVEPRRLLQVAGLGILSVGVNLWFLLPNIVFSTRTLITDVADPANAEPWFGDPGTLFHPFRVLPQGDIPSTPSIYGQLPVLVLVWLVAAYAITRPRTSDPWRRAGDGLAVLLGLTAFLLIFRFPWNVIPQPFVQVQFPLRITMYAILSIVGLLILGLRALGYVQPELRRMLVLGLIVAVWFGFVVANWQIWSTASTFSSRQVALQSRTQVPPSVYDTNLFKDGSAPVVGVARRRSVSFAPTAVHDNKLDVVVDLPTGRRPIKTNIATGTYLVDVDGVEPVGRTKLGDLVVRRTKDNLRGPVRVRVKTKNSGPVVIGRYASFLSVGGLLVVLLFVARRRPRPKPARARAHDLSRPAPPPRRAKVAP